MFFVLTIRSCIFVTRSITGYYHQYNYAVGDIHINGIEGFWGYAKVRLVKFRGLSKNSFYLHLKECKFRF